MLIAAVTFCNSLEIAHVLLHPRLVLIVFILLHVLIPLITLTLGRLFLPNDPLFMTGLVLEFSSPTAITDLMWTGTCNGNIHLCLSMVLLDTLLAPITIPLVLQALIDSVMHLDVLGMMTNLLAMAILQGG